jgi:hypothetical protein
MIVFGGLASNAASVEDAPPWKTNPPIATVRKELYRRHARPREAALASVNYVGAKLERREVQAEEVKDDVGDNVRARWSMDNGRTWDAFVPVQPSNNVHYAGVTVWEGEGPSVFDPVTGVLVQAWLRQIVVDGLYHCFTYTRLSRDLGRTWSEPQQLRYEDGAAFDPRAPKQAAFLDHNEGYFGNNLLVRKDGTIVHVLAHSNAPGDAKNRQRPWRMGSVLFLGRWNAARKDYDWTPGARVEISPDRSARGLMEPEVAELSDGRLLVVWRGSTHGWDGSVAKLPGRKFFSLSTDGGRTLTPPAVWKYDDGSDFYSPSSIHRMVRHSVSGKLYWLGNLCATPPSGNSPRYPLVIAEVDEAKAALKRSTVTAIDDRQPGQSASVQFSNFSLLENRETHEFELYLTTYGQESDPADWATADSTKYFVKLQDSSATKPHTADRPQRKRRVLYNFDGDSCLSTKAGGKGPVAVNVDDVKRLIEEVAYDGSRVDTVLVCINAQVMYYPTKVGTMRGMHSTPEERAQWPASERQRFENLKAFFDRGVDPYAVMLAETRRRGREALLSFRMNDDHGNDFLRTQFLADHPDWRLGTEQYRGKGAIDFGRAEVREYTFRLIEEAVGRYDCDGIELDFNRFPTFFKDGTTDERVAKMNALVERVRKMLDAVESKRERRLVLAVRVPSNYGRTPPTPETARQLGCDVSEWAKRGWVDFVTVSEFLFERGDLPIGQWKQAITTVPVYGGIECTKGGGQKNLTADEYRQAAQALKKAGADGAYLFNFFTSREGGEQAYDPPYAVLRDLEPAD